MVLSSRIRFVVATALLARLLRATTSTKQEYAKRASITPFSSLQCSNHIQLQSSALYVASPSCYGFTFTLWHRLEPASYALPSSKMAPHSASKLTSIIPFSSPPYSMLQLRLWLRLDARTLTRPGLFFNPPHSNPTFCGPAESG
jgi:hypothetical protein